MLSPGPKEAARANWIGVAIGLVVAGVTLFVERDLLAVSLFLGAGGLVFSVIWTWPRHSQRQRRTRRVCLAATALATFLLAASPLAGLLGRRPAEQSLAAQIEAAVRKVLQEQREAVPQAPVATASPAPQSRDATRLTETLDKTVIRGAPAESNPELRIKIEEVIARGYIPMIDDPSITREWTREGWATIEDVQSSTVVLIVRVENPSPSVASTAALRGFAIRIPDRETVLSVSILVPPRMGFNVVMPKPFPIERRTLFGTDYLLDKVQTTPVPPGGRVYGLLHFTAQHVTKAELVKTEATYQLLMTDIRGQNILDEYRGRARAMPSPQHYPGVRVETSYFTPSEPRASR